MKNKQKNQKFIVKQKQKKLIEIMKFSKPKIELHFLKKMKKKLLVL